MAKILFIVTQSEMGGAQRYVFEIASFLANEKWEVTVAAGEGDGELFNKISNLKTENSKLQLKTQNLKHLKRTPNPFSQIYAVAEIYGLLKKEKPEILFLCSTTAGFLGSIARFLYKNCNLLSRSCKNKIREYNLRTIYRIGGWAFKDPRPFWQNWVILWTEKLTAPLKDKIIVNSEIDKKLAIKYRIAKAEKIVKIYNGLDINSLNFLPKEKARKELLKHFEQFKHQTIVGTVANFYKTKGLPYLIEAMSKIKSQISNVICLIIGEGKERSKLEVQIKKYGLENQVFLAGRIPDGYRYLKAFDIFVLPSLKEGFPWVILEAMAAKIPIVATKVGAIPELIEDKKSGLLVPPANSQMLARKIKQILLENSEFKKKLVKEAQKKLAHFNKTKMLKATKNLLNL